MENTHTDHGNHWGGRGLKEEEQERVMKEKKDKYFIYSNKWDHLDLMLYLNIYIYECNYQFNGERTVFPISSYPNEREP